MFDWLAQYDWIIFAAGIVAVIVLEIRRRRRAAARAELVELVPTSISNVEAAFYKPAQYQTLTEREDSIIDRVFTTARRVWPSDIVSAIDESEFRVWLVRSADMLICWRAYDGIAWRIIPPLNGIPATDPDNGYGGMCERNSCTLYVAMFIERRSPYLLLVHELTHCIAPVNDHSDPAFLELERQLADEVQRYLITAAVPIAKGQLVYLDEEGKARPFVG